MLVRRLVPSGEQPGWRCCPGRHSEAPYLVTDIQDPGMALRSRPVSAMHVILPVTIALSSRQSCFEDKKIFCRATYAMLVLQETPAGFALFSVADKKIKQADKVRRAV